MRTKPDGFSKAAINALALPSKNRQVHYADPELDRHFVRVTQTGARSFVVKRNDSRRGLFSLTLGPAGTDELTATNARKLAVIALGLHAQGFPHERIKEQIAFSRARLHPVPGRVEPKTPTTYSDGISLQAMLDRYILERGHRLASATKEGYRRVADTYFADLRHRPLDLLDEDAVVERFLKITSKSRANFSLGVLNMLFEYGMGVRKDGKPLITENPVRVLTHRELWHRLKPRTDVIAKHHLRAWWDATGELGDRSREMVRDEMNLHFAKGTAAHNSHPETWRDY